jgi:hypothetical protein
MGAVRMLPACNLTVDKKTQPIKIENFQNPGKLSDPMVSQDLKTLAAALRAFEQNINNAHAVAFGSGFHRTNRL